MDLNLKRIFEDDTDKCICIDGYFENTSLLCEQCHSNCFTCDNNAANTCLSCNANIHRVLSGTECICMNSVSVDINSC